MYTTGANCINCDAKWCYFHGKLGNTCTGYVEKLPYVYGISDKTIEIKKEEKEFYCPHCGNKFKTEV